MGGYKYKYYCQDFVNSLILKELLIEEYNILKFKFKYLISPIQLGINNDNRNLAVYFSKIDFYK
ncbi:unnamed protein product [marine sediment metagenome]|uniref:Uncharacterized protein n=1 Tax=marine sediment metagenome TaxID=412755 RepID=X1CBX7_9ZZZZ